MVERGRTGLITPSADAPSLARALTELLDDRPRRLRMGRAAAASATARFDAHRMVSDTFGWCMEVLECWHGEQRQPAADERYASGPGRWETSR